MPLAELNYSSSHYTPRTPLNEVCKIKITNIALHLHRQRCDFSETAQRKSYSYPELDIVCFLSP